MPTVIYDRPSSAVSIFDDLEKEKQASAARRIQSRSVSQRAGYYDYLNALQKQKLEQTENSARGASFAQRALNKNNAKLHDHYRRQIARERKVIGDKVAFLDKTIGFATERGLTAEQIAQRKEDAEAGGFVGNLAGTNPDQYAVERLAAYGKLLGTDDFKASYIEGGATGSYDRLVSAFTIANNAIRKGATLDKSTTAIGLIEGNTEFINESGTKDYRFDASDHLIEYYKSVYGRDPFTQGQITSSRPLSKGEMSSARETVSTYDQKQRPGGKLIPSIRPGEKGYVTRHPALDIREPEVEPAPVEGVAPAAPAPPDFLQQLEEGYGPELSPSWVSGLPRDQMMSPEYVTPFPSEVPREAPQLMPMDREEAQQISPPAIPSFVPDDEAEPEMFSEEWQENLQRERDNSYYRRKLDETNATISDMLRRSEGGNPSTTFAWYDKAVRDRAMYEGLIEYTNPQQLMPMPWQPEELPAPPDQPTPPAIDRPPVDEGRPEVEEAVLPTMMPREVAPAPPAPAPKPPTAPAVPAEPPPPLPSVRRDMVPEAGVVPYYADTLTPEQRDVYYDAINEMGERGSTGMMERRVPSREELDSLSSFRQPYRDPRYDAGYGFADIGADEYVPPFDRGPLVDRSYPEMGRINDADYPTAFDGGELVELNTFGGPTLMRRQRLMDRGGNFPTLKEILPELREPLDYENYPGNPLYRRGGPLYEE